MHRLARALNTSSVPQDMVNHQALQLMTERAAHAAAKQLAEHLQADNAVLADLLAQQSAILEAIRAAREAQRGVRADQGQSSEQPADQEEAEAEDAGGDGVAAQADEPQEENCEPESAKRQAAGESGVGEVREPPGEGPRPLPQETVVRRRSLLGSLWSHVAGYDDAPHGQAL